MDDISYKNAVPARRVPTASRPVRLALSLADTFRGWALGVAVAGFLFTASCATPVTILTVSAPSTATAGSPITVTVTALANGNRDKIFNMDVRFSSSDSAAILPNDYTFTAADSGSHTFTGGITFMTPGAQSLTATATFAHSITGTANVTVSATNNVVQK